MSGPVSLTVVGSVNLDIVATGPDLPAPGETVTGAVLAHHPGGKGANQAIAARRLGAEVSLIARVGKDAAADEALALLKEGGVDLGHCLAHETAATGVALIAVSDAGENQIIVASGANDELAPDDIPAITTDATLCVLEVPLQTVIRAAQQSEGFFAINLAPALEVPDSLIERADLISVNETEAAVYGVRLNACRGWVVETYGAKGAALLKAGKRVAEAAPPEVTPVDTTGAGDMFTAALTVALCEGMAPQAALEFANAAGSLAVSKPGAQPSLPLRAEVEALLS